MERRMGKYKENDDKLDILAHKYRLSKRVKAEKNFNHEES